MGGDIPVPASAPRVLVTRPAEDAPALVAALRGAGLDAWALPLLAIEPLADVAPLRAAWAQRGAQAAWMFVSTAAVRHFFAQRPADVDLADLPQAWAPGPGTAAALRAFGVPAAHIVQPSGAAESFDSEALWAVVQGRLPAGSHVCIVRGSEGDGASPAADAAGGSGRDWLAQRLRDSGVQVDFLAAYVRRAVVPQGDAAERARRALADGSVWLLSHARAITHLAQAWPASDWSGARAVATHPRVAQAARSAGFGVVLASRPELYEMVASIKSIA